MNAARPIVLIVLAALALSTSCATTPTLAPPAVQTWPAGVAAGDPDDADYVVLHEARRYLVVNPPSRPGTTTTQHHRVIKVLTEAGFAQASAHVFIPAKNELLHFSARTIAPDGTVHDVDPTTVLNDVANVGDDSSATRSFQFPRVTVGSVLEVTTTMSAPWATWFVFDHVGEDVPVRHYEVEILLDRFVVPDVFVNNAKPALDYDKNVDGLQRIHFELNDVEAVKSQSWRPPWRALSPWWSYRAVEWAYPNGRQPAASTWGRALNGTLHARLAAYEDIDGLAPLRGHERCAGDSDCVVAAALKQLETLTFSGFDDFYVCRPLQQVQTSGTANNHEKALALWKLLFDAGVDAHIAVTTHDVDVDAAETFPSPIWFDHTLVHLPATATKPARFIDPSCEHCRPGEIPPWIASKRAVSISRFDGQYGPELRASDFIDVVGTVTRAYDLRRTATMTVGADGAVEIVEDEVREGRSAVDVMVDEATMTDDDIKRELTKALRERDKSVVVTKAARFDCKRADARCTRRIAYTLPALGTVVGGGAKIVVPVFALHSTIEQSFTSTPPADRRYDVHIGNDNVLHESVHLVPPPGYRFVGEHPAPKDVAIGGLEMSSTVKKAGDGLQIERRHHVIVGKHGKAHWQKLHEAMKAGAVLHERVVNFERIAPTPTTTTTTTAPAPTTPTPTTPTTP